MDHRSLSAGLLARLRRETNGAVVADMEDRGLHYGRSYGVSLHTVRSVAKEFAPDHEFAKYLWRQPVRELKLAGINIADPEQITIDELKFWFDGASNTELAENLASFLLSKTRYATRILELYGSSPNPAEQYAAILSAARGNTGNIPAELIVACAGEAADSENPALLRAAGLLLSRAAVNRDPLILEYIDSIEKQALLDEIMI